MKIKTRNVNFRVFLILLSLFALCNEIYRHVEVSRLRERGCQYVGMGRKTTNTGINPSRKVRQFVNLYECNDGVELTSIYRNDRFVRPWE